MVNDVKFLVFLSVVIFLWLYQRVLPEWVRSTFWQPLSLMFWHYHGILKALSYSKSHPKRINTHGNVPSHGWRNAANDLNDATQLGFIRSQSVAVLLADAFPTSEIHLVAKNSCWHCVVIFLVLFCLFSTFLLCLVLGSDILNIVLPAECYLQFVWTIQMVNT